MKAHLNNLLLVAVSFSLFFLFHTGGKALKVLTTPENMNEGSDILAPVSIDLRGEVR